MCSASEESLPARFRFAEARKKPTSALLLVSTYRGNCSSSLVVSSYIMSHIVGQNRAYRKKEEKSVCRGEDFDNLLRFLLDSR